MYRTMWAEKGRILRMAILPHTVRVYYRSPVHTHEFRVRIRAIREKQRSW